MIGARQGTMTVLQRLVAAAMSRDIRGFVVPGADVARAAGIDLGGTGLRLSATPRHANVLVVIAPLPAYLVDAASVAYAQMPRPRSILALGSDDLAPLPNADATGPLTQAGLVAAMTDLRRVIATGAFRPDVQDYEAPALQVRTEYTCPMHPEVLADEPGNCPKCGMALVLRETATSPHAGHSKPEHEHKMTADTLAKTMAAGHDHAKGGQGAGHGHEKHAVAETTMQYTCPMHPEIVSDEPGSCPKCGMYLVAAEDTAKDSGHDHEVHDKGHESKGDDQSGHGAHGNGEAIEGVEAHFMSMADLTRDMPASSDGLKMEWIDVPFGPFFPGLPGGLRLDLTLDGDAVASSSADSVVDKRPSLHGDATPLDAFANHFATLSPLSPVSYRLLACLALEQAAGQSVAPDVARARIAAIERERIASHLGWLAEFGAQSGFAWLENHATALQLKLRDATVTEMAALTTKITAFLTRVQRTPLLNSRLKGIGRLVGDDALLGLVARAGGIARDARSDDPIYAELGFAVLTATDGDALARLALRCGEIPQSLDLISRAGAIALPVPRIIGTASGTGEAVVETPRGAARLSLTLQKGKVTAADMSTPTAGHIALIATVADGRELGDALTGIGSLDISPWEVTV